MNFLLEKNFEKQLKPDFNTKSGREEYADYLSIMIKKFIDIDKKNNTSVFKRIKPDFITRFSKRLVTNPQKRILIGIWGESASGKSTICNTVEQCVQKFDLPVEFLSTDNYFRDISALIKQHGSFDKLLQYGYDVDSPSNFNMELLFEDLTSLSNGNDVKIPQYLVNGTGVVVPNAIEKKSQKIIIVEGMASMYESVSGILDVKIYVDIDPKTQKQWFLNRAVTSRNQNRENALKQFDYVKNASKKYILPQKEKADIFINGATPLEYFKQIIEYFYMITNNFVVPDN